MDKYEVTNSEFWFFTTETGYKTDAEKFGNSYVFDMCLPKDVLDKAEQMVQVAPWWIQIEGACWSAPEGKQGPGSAMMTKKSDVTMRFFCVFCVPH